MALRSVPGVLLMAKECCSPSPGQLCYQNSRKVLGLKEHLDTETCLKQGMSQKLPAWGVIVQNLE